MPRRVLDLTRPSETQVAQQGPLGRGRARLQLSFPRRTPLSEPHGFTCNVDESPSPTALCSLPDLWRPLIGRAGQSQKHRRLGAGTFRAGSQDRIAPWALVTIKPTPGQGERSVQTRWGAQHRRLATGTLHSLVRQPHSSWKPGMPHSCPHCSVGKGEKQLLALVWTWGAAAGRDGDVWKESGEAEHVVSTQESFILFCVSRHRLLPPRCTPPPVSSRRLGQASLPLAPALPSPSPSRDMRK